MNTRHQKVLDWRKEGKTFREIAELLGTGRSRAFQIYNIAKEKEEKNNG